MPQIVGAGGDLRVGYQHAGTIAGWTVTTTPRADGEVSIDVDFVPGVLDPFWSTQRPMTVSLNWFGRRRVWRNVAPLATSPTWRLADLPAPEVL